MSLKLSIELHYKAGGFGMLTSWVKGIATHSMPLCKCCRVDCAHPFYLRANSSDVAVYEQVFTDAEYNFPQNAHEMEYIVDAGANIGLSAIYFANRFPKAKIVAIEPEPSNFELLQKNVSHYKNITPLCAALWNANENLSLFTKRQWDKWSPQVAVGGGGYYGDNHGQFDGEIQYAKN